MKSILLLCLLASFGVVAQVNTHGLPDGAMAVGQFNNTMFSQTKLGSNLIDLIDQSDRIDDIDTVSIGLYVKDTISCVFLVHGSISLDNSLELVHRGYFYGHLTLDLDNVSTAGFENPRGRDNVGTADFENPRGRDNVGTADFETDYIAVFYSDDTVFISSKSMVDDVLDTLENQTKSQTLSIDTNRVSNEWFFLHVNEVNEVTDTVSLFIGEFGDNMLTSLYVEFYDKEQAQLDAIQLQENLPVLIMMTQFMDVPNEIKSLMITMIDELTVTHFNNTVVIEMKCPLNYSDSVDYSDSYSVDYSDSYSVDYSDSYSVDYFDSDFVCGYNYNSSYASYIGEYVYHENDDYENIIHA